MRNRCGLVGGGREGPSPRTGPGQGPRLPPPRAAEGTFIARVLSLLILTISMATDQETASEFCTACDKPTLSQKQEAFLPMMDQREVCLVAGCPFGSVKGHERGPNAPRDGWEAETPARSVAWPGGVCPEPELPGPQRVDVRSRTRRLAPPGRWALTSPRLLSSAFHLQLQRNFRQI